MDTGELAQASRSHAWSVVSGVDEERIAYESEARDAAEDLSQLLSEFLDWWYRASFGDAAGRGEEARAVAKWRQGRVAILGRYRGMLDRLHRYGFDEKVQEIERAASDAVLADQLIHHYYESPAGKECISALTVSERGRGPPPSHPLHAMFDAAHSRLCVDQQVTHAMNLAN